MLTMVWDIFVTIVPYSVESGEGALKPRQLWLNFFFVIQFIVERRSGAFV